MTLTPHDHSRTYFSRIKAEKMASTLRASGAHDVEIWSRKDAFGQTEYILCWNR